MTDIVRDPYGNPLNRDKLIIALRAENERIRAALEVCNRVLHFDLRQMITFGPDYNQAVKDAADAARAALEKE